MRNISFLDPDPDLNLDPVPLVRYIVPVPTLESYFFCYSYQDPDPNQNVMDTDHYEIKANLPTIRRCGLPAPLCGVFSAAQQRR